LWIGKCIQTNTSKEKNLISCNGGSTGAVVGGHCPTQRNFVSFNCVNNRSHQFERI